MIAQAELKKELHYNPDTGVFTRLYKYKGPASVGDVAGSGSGDTKRYNTISIKSVSYKSANLAFLYINGRMPIGVLDHISGDALDDRWCNLREVTIQQNNMNKAKGKNNKSGVVGVHWSVRDNSWKSQINVMGKRIHLGFFKDFFEAVCARKSAQQKHGFHHNHGRISPLASK